KRSGSVIRGAYGTFYDRLFDNAWQNVRNNNFVLANAFPVTSPSTNYLAPVASVLPAYQGQPIIGFFADPIIRSTRAPTTMFQPRFRTPYVQSFFFGLQQPLSRAWATEAYYLGSLGRKLITTDIVNRASTGYGLAGSAIGPILYRANQGTSSYNALSTVIRYRAVWAQFQAA